MYRVQIVDDEPITRIGLRTLIPWEKYGFEVCMEAQNGEEAFQQVQEHNVDVIVTDIEMPIMNGLEYIKKLRNENFEQPIVILTAYGEFEYAQKAIHYHVSDYILKPIEEEQINNTLTNLRNRLDAVNEENRSSSKKTLSQRVYTRQYDNQLVSYVLLSDDKYKESLNLILKEEQDLAADIEGTYLRCISILEDLITKVLSKYHNIDKINNLNQYMERVKSNSIDKDLLLTHFSSSIYEIFELIRSFNLSYNLNIIRQACQYVIEHVDEKISLTSVSEYLCISKNYFCSLFKQEIGENFLNYVSQAKMQRAKYLLKEKNMKVYEVCEQLGYVDTAYFTRLFKKYTSMTPYEYKRTECENYESEIC